MATRAALGLAAILWMACTLAAVADTLSGRVVRVVDGDTLILLVAGAGGQQTQERIRLAAVDAPERGQPWGEKAKQALAAHVFGRDVMVEWTRRDRFGRVVGKVIDGGQDVNLAMIRDGMARWFRRFAAEQSAADRKLYEEAENRARLGRVGLWSEENPTPPAERRGRERHLLRFGKYAVDMDDLPPALEPRPLPDLPDGRL
jgi:endonuclease YncB( thermonuclease family)